MSNYHLVPKQYMSRQHPDYSLMGQSDVHHIFKISTYIGKSKVTMNYLTLCKIHRKDCMYTRSHLHDVLDILKVLI